MSLTFLAPARLPGALAESARAPLRLANLERLLLSSSIAVDPRPVEQWLCERLGIATAEDAPIAPLRLAAESARFDREARSGYWVCADPIATTTGIDAVRVDRLVDDLDAADAGAIVATLSQFFAADGLRVIAAAPSRWYVRADAPQRLSTTPLDRVLGMSMLNRMPRGEDSAAWRGRLNEVQMLLHEHPVNLARERRGQSPVGSCWWWGGGTWPAWRSAEVDVVVGGAGWIDKACRENRIDAEAGTVDTHADPGALARLDARRALIIAADGSSEGEDSEPCWQHCDRTWLRSVLRALDERAIERAAIVLPWDEATLEIVVARSPAIPRWRRWLGRAESVAPPLTEALRPYLQ